MDFISKSGDIKVKATHGGVVRVVSFDASGYGNYVTIDQYDGYRSLYAHLAEALVVPGQEINMGDVIGMEGETGNATGIHLHYEVRKYPYNQVSSIDPCKYLLIQNEEGSVKYLELSLEEQKKLIKERAKLEDSTIQYFEYYRYGKELIQKLTDALR